MESQKSVLLPVTLAVLASAVVFGGVGYYMANNKGPTDTTVTTQPTVRPTTASSPVTASPTAANLSTYTNKNYKFSLQYPSNWKIDDNTQTSGEAGANNSLVLYNGSLPKDDLSLTLWVNPAGHSMEPPEASYEFSYQNGKIVFGDRKATSSSSGDVFQPAKGSIQFTGTINGVKYFFVGRNANNLAMETQLKNIVSTLKSSL